MVVWKNRRNELNMALALTTAWQVWVRRNKMVFENKWKSNFSVQHQAAIVLSWMSAKAAKAAHNGGSNANTKWTKPADGWSKINVDAGFNGQMSVGLGAVIRDSDGLVVSAAVERLCARWSVLVAELKAARGESVYRNEAGTVVNEIFRHVGSFARVSFSHVKRDCNTCAHSLAKDEYYTLNESWVNCSPLRIKDSVLYDLFS